MYYLYAFHTYTIKYLFFKNNTEEIILCIGYINNDIYIYIYNDIYIYKTC